MGKRKRKNTLKSRVKRLTGGGRIMSDKNIRRWCRAMTAK